jgi:hypothetical protein
VACKNYLRLSVDPTPAGGEACIDRLWDELPEEWLNESFGDPRCRLDKGASQAVISSPRSDSGFWSISASCAP